MSKMDLKVVGAGLPRTGTSSLKAALERLLWVDWPASMFWRELSEANPDALVLLSVRDSADVWRRSFDDMVLPPARLSLATEWAQGRDLVTLLERFTGTEQWDHPETLMEAYERHNARVRKAIPQQRLLEWRATEGWEPICRRLGVAAPDLPFPWIDGRNTEAN